MPGPIPQNRRDPLTASVRFDFNDGGVHFRLRIDKQALDHEEIAYEG